MASRVPQSVGEVATAVTKDSIRVTSLITQRRA